MANNTLLATDTFASGSLAAGWTNAFGDSVGQVIGSGATAVWEANTVNVAAGQLWNGLTWPSDQISEVTVKTLLTTTSIITLNVRYSLGATTGYQVNIQVGAAQASNSIKLYELTAGSATQLGSTINNIAYATGDVWSLTAFGPCLCVYLNYALIMQWVDVTHTSGYPGFTAAPQGNINQVQVSSWRGYSAVQQDGIWTKQGAAKIPYVAGDINTGANNANSGLDSASQILHEGNAQILSGTVYKMWFGTSSGIQYAESSDGLNWSRYGSTVIAGFTFPSIIKSGSTYYLYVQSNTASPGKGNVTLYNSTDGITWGTAISSTVLALGTAGTWDSGNIYLFSVVTNAGGNWKALYSGVDDATGKVFGLGLATSSDGITWTKYGSNPVASRVWASVPYLISGNYYLWGSGVPPGLGASGALDPSPTTRLYSADLITWSAQTPSLHNSATYEGVNNVTGFAYATALMTIGGTTYMYYEAGPVNTASTTGASWNLGYASTPATLAQIVTNNENALQAVATDAFTSGAGDLSANWTTLSGQTKLKIIAGPLVEPTATATICGAYYSGASFGNDQYSSCTLNALATSSCFMVLAVRCATSSFTEYEAVIVGATGSRQTAASYIYKRIAAGGSAQLGPFITFTPQVGDVFTFTAIGNVLSLYQNGWLIDQVQDAANSITSGAPGFWLDGATGLTQAQVSSWQGGNTNVVPAYASGNAGALSLRRRRRRDVIS